MPLSADHRAKIAAGVRAYHKCARATRCAKAPRKPIPGEDFRRNVTRYQSKGKAKRRNKAVQSKQGGPRQRARPPQIRTEATPKKATPKRKETPIHIHSTPPAHHPLALSPGEEKRVEEWEHRTRGHGTLADYDLSSPTESEIAENRRQIAASRRLNHNDIAHGLTIEEKQRGDHGGWGSASRHRLAEDYGMEYGEDGPHKEIIESIHEEEGQNSKHWKTGRSELEKHNDSTSSISQPRNELRHHFTEHEVHREVLNHLLDKGKAMGHRVEIERPDGNGYYTVHHNEDVEWDGGKDTEAVIGRLKKAHPIKWKAMEDNSRV